MTYEIKGVELDENDMYKVYMAYRQHCTAEQLMFEADMDRDEAMSIALDVLDAMDNNNLTESEAIESILCNRSM